MHLRLIPTLFLTAFFFGAAYADDDSGARPGNQIAATEAYVNLPLPGKTNSAAFFTLNNSGSETAVLIGVEADIAARAELHSHSHDNGIMRMRKESEVAVPPKSTLVFAPGGWHVMLFDVRPGLKTGDSLHLTLKFADGSSLLVPARARSLFDQPHH